MYWKPRIQTRTAVIVLMLLTLGLGCTGPKQMAEGPGKEVPTPTPSTSEPPTEELTVPQIQEEVPAQLTAATADKLYTLRVRDAQLKDVLLAFARESGENLVVDPDVTGTVTVDLNQVTLEQALDAILTPLGYVYRKQGRLIRVSRPLMETRVFTLSYIATSRKGVKKITATHGTGGTEGEGPSGSKSSVTGTDESDPWVEIQEGLTAIVFSKEKAEEVIKARKEGPVTSLTSKDGRKLVISRMSGVIVVRDYMDKLRGVAEYLERVEGSVQRQVLIQAELLEVDLKDEYKTGIRWDNIQNELLELNISTMEINWDLNDGTSASGTVGVVGAALDASGNPYTLNDVVEALGTQGEVTAIASPKVATLNNQVAIVKITNQDVYYTGETVLTGTSGLGEQTFTPHVVDIGVILDVTPQIDGDGSIIMNIHPSFSEKIEDVPSPDGITTFPLLSVRETDTVIRVRDGQTVIIAGLLGERKDEERVGLPCLMSMPGALGAPFRHTDYKMRRNELVILITPTVMVGRRIDELSSEEIRRLDDLKEESPLR